MTMYRPYEAKSSGRFIFLSLWMSDVQTSFPDFRDVIGIAEAFFQRGLLQHQVDADIFRKSIPTETVLNQLRALPQDHPPVNGTERLPIDGGGNF